MQNEIRIFYSSKTNERLSYAAVHLLTEILGVAVSITDSKSDFLNHSGPAINYSGENLAHGLWVHPHGLLEETNIHPLDNPDVLQWNGFSCFFPQNEGDIPFDIFAASFYLLSRYEEYTTFESDEHGRFDPQKSLAYKHHFLEIPVVDRWAYLLKDELQKKYPEMGFPLRRFRSVSTFDTDHPYQFRKKGIIRTFSALGRDAIRFNLKQIGERISVQLRLKSDPYMKATQWIDQWQKTAGKNYFLFILRGNRGKYGTSAQLPPHAYSEYFRGLESAIIGLHPSYETYKNLELLIKERKELEEIIEHKIMASRHHFLRISLPETFQELIVAGIKDDFSLAYAHAPGFRSGTAIPHRFYDLEQEKITGLLLHPTVMMDTTLIMHKKLSPEDALKKIKFLIDECYQSGGDYVSLWHNSNLAGNSQSNPWIEVFSESFRYASALEKNS